VKLDVEPVMKAPAYNPNTFDNAAYCMNHPWLTTMN